MRTHQVGVGSAQPSPASGPAATASASCAIGISYTASIWTRRTSLRIENEPTPEREFGCIFGAMNTTRLRQNEPTSPSSYHPTIDTTIKWAGESAETAIRIVGVLNNAQDVYCGRVLASSAGGDTIAQPNQNMQQHSRPRGIGCAIWR